MDIEILFENEEFLAINKPSGISVHGDGRSTEKTIVDWILEKYPHLRDVGESMKTQNGEILRPGIVHRLDKETSGVLLIAKTKQSFEHIKKEFQERRIQKEYFAIVHGVVRQDTGEIELPIGRSTQDPRKRAAKKAGKVRDAHTAYRAEKRYKEYSALSVFPKTGRMHQIRVHLNSIGHPVVCDKLYSRFVCPQELGRLALHAKKITLHNVSGEEISIEAPLPSLFLNFLEKQSSL